MSPIPAAWLSLDDGGPPIRCRDEAHAKRLGEVYLTLSEGLPQTTSELRDRIERLAEAGRRRAPD